MPTHDTETLADADFEVLEDVICLALGQPHRGTCGRIARDIAPWLAARDAVVAAQAKAEALREAAEAWPGLRTEGNVYTWLMRLAAEETRDA